MYNQTQVTPEINQNDQLQQSPTMEIKRSIDATVNGEMDQLISKPAPKKHNNPKIEDLNRFLDHYHPRNQHGKPYNYQETFSFKTGSHCLCGSTTSSQVDEFGGGVTLYFRFIKQMIFYFFVITILSIPQMYLSYLAGIQQLGGSNGYGLSITDWFMLTTAGQLSTIQTSCYSTNLQYMKKSTTQIGQSKKNTLYCSTGTLTYDYMTVGIYDYQTFSGSCMFVNPYDVDDSCFLDEGQAFFDDFDKYCIGKQRCDFQFSSKYFDTTYCAEYFGDQSQYFNAYIQVYCSGSEVSASNYTTSVSQVSIICSMMDFFICIIFLLSLLFLKYADQEALMSVKQNQVFVSNYTLEYKNFPKRSLKSNLIIKVKEFVENSVRTKFPSLSNIDIPDIQLGQSNRYISLHKERGNLLIQRDDIIERFEVEFQVDVVDDTDQKGLYCYEKIQAFIQQKFPPKDAFKARGMLNSIRKLEDKLRKIESQLLNEKIESQEDTLSVFVTFETVEQRNYAIYIFSPDRVRDCCFSCCGNMCVDVSLQMFDKNIVEAKVPPDPENIIWENFLVSATERFLRRSFSIVITIAIIIISMTIIVLLRQEQNALEKDNPTISCSQWGSISKKEVIIDLQKDSGELGLLECYCKADLADRLNEDFPAGYKDCNTWLADKTKTMSTQFAIVVTILFINQIIKFVFTRLSSFERHQLLSKQLSSRAIKLFLVQFFNTALIIFIVNIKFRKDSDSTLFFFAGKFSDTSLLWFKQVGTTVIFTMFTNIFQPILFAGISALFRWMKKCCDLCGVKPPAFTRKKTQKEFNMVHLGPTFDIEIKYAQVVNIIAVCWFYSSGLPFLYFTTFCFLIVTYWVDKCMLLLVCQKPVKIDKKIGDHMRRILQIFIIIHLFWSIWIYGNSQIFQEANIGLLQSTSTQAKLEAMKSINKYTDQNSYANIFLTRLTMNQNIPILLLLIITLLAFVIVPYAIRPIFKTIFFFCYTPKSKYFEKILTRAVSIRESFYNLIPAEAIKKQIRLIKYKILHEQDKAYQNYLVTFSNRLMQVAKDESQKVKFSGLTSYDILMNENYEQHLPDVFLREDS